MELTFGFSTCPNDTYIFDALYNKKIDWQGLSFKFILADVEELNRLAFQGKIDVTKLSYHAFALVAESYCILESGSALGRNNGPLLVGTKAFPLSEIENLHIAIPGKMTTANLLLSSFFPKVKKKTEYLFSDIEKAVLCGEADAGLLIHENRFTYAERGLKKIVDFGEFWEEHTHSPIPLGGIVARKSLPSEVIVKLNILIRQSLETSNANPAGALPFIRQFAQEMDEKVMQSHIALYVNDFSLALGDEGKRAIRFLYQKAEEHGVIGHIPQDIFSTERTS
jgi:1,4-dihydroxy-6-naphthoate synthase